MGLMVWGAVFCGAGVYFLLDCLKSKLAWFKSGDLKRGLVIFFASGGLFGGGFLADYLGSSFPPESYEETKSIPLSPFLGQEGNVYAVIEKENIIFLRQGKLVRRKREEINTIISFLSEGSMFPPQAVELAGKRGFFQKLFLLDSIKVRFIVPPSGIKEGSVRAVSSYEFVALSP